MSEIQFKDLVEVQFTESKIQSSQKKIKDEENRIIFLKNQILEKDDENLDCTNKKKLLEHRISTGEADLHQVDKKIEKSEENISNAKNEKEAKASESSLNILIPRRNELEESILEYYEELDSLDSLIKECSIFSSGAKDTLRELVDEVDLTIKKIKSEIQELENYSEGILDSVNKQSSSLFCELNKTFKHQQPLSYIKDGVCSKCNFSIEKSTEMQINKGSLVDHCPNCGRLLCPITTFNFTADLID